MISAPIYALGLIGEDGGQHLVGTPAFAKGRCFDRRGADERVAEGDAARTFVRPYQLVALGRGEIVELVLAAARRFQHPDIPGTLQGRGQEDRPGRGREPHDPGGEQLLQALSERQHRRKRLPRRALRIAQRLRQLQQGERVASRRVQHRAPHPGDRVRETWSSPGGQPPGHPGASAHIPAGRPGQSSFPRRSGRRPAAPPSCRRAFSPRSSARRRSIRCHDTAK